MNSSHARLTAAPDAGAGPIAPEVDILVPGPELTVIIPTLNERDNILPLVDRLRRALSGIAWELIFVDDDSRDGTVGIVHALASRDRRIRGMRRIGRRGLAGACIEGVLSSSAPLVAVMDADLQHDETCLSQMFATLRKGKADLVVPSRYGGEGDAAGGLTRIRHAGSRLAIRIAQKILKVDINDPMSGFFMIRREIVVAMAPRLSQRGFKILLDIVASSGTRLAIAEVPYTFQPRLHGESKLDASVVMEYLGLVVSKASGDLISTRLLGFGLVGSLGLLLHISILRLLLLNALSFPVAQALAMFAAMTFNYALNNELTYRDRRRRGWRFLTGLCMFGILCSFGVVAGVGVSTFFYNNDARWWLDGLAGAVVGAAWNYVTNSSITWRAR